MKVSLPLQLESHSMPVIFLSGSMHESRFVKKLSDFDIISNFYVVKVCKATKAEHMCFGFYLSEFEYANSTIIANFDSSDFLSFDVQCRAYAQIGQKSYLLICNYRYNEQIEFENQWKAISD